MQKEIEIHIVAYNEEIMLPFTIAHYRKMFKNPYFIIHDNNSTDNTVKVVEKACKGVDFKIIPFSTEGMNDSIQSQIKSDSALNAKSKWVLCIDADEECLIDSADLEFLEKENVNIVEFDGWNIFDQVESPWDIKIPMGTRSGGYSKPVLLKTNCFKEITFAAGAHALDIITPKEGIIAKWSKAEYKLLHYKHWSCNWNIARSAELGSRQSKDNLEKKHSFHFLFPKETHESYFNEYYNQREIIKDSKIN